jgi:hypothetical protein
MALSIRFGHHAGHVLAWTCGHTQLEQTREWKALQLEQPRASCTTTAQLESTAARATKSKQEQAAQRHRNFEALQPEQPGASKSKLHNDSTTGKHCS